FGGFLFNSAITCKLGIIEHLTISSSTDFQKILEQHQFLNLGNSLNITFQISIGVERIQLSWI
ncbi:MAG: hypothetical protein VYD06_01620, partial [SAR324 cluster bacterium]|nr:hypothetical protein [SAR324 cluster bacterium]